jgi:uncharacterized RDD family membrane protein YckC
MPYCKKCGTALPEGASYCPKCGTAAVMEEASAPKLAFWSERFVAWLIDIAIIGVILGILWLVTWFFGQSFTPWSGWPASIPFFNFAPSSIVYFLYWTFLEGAYGQSLGKMVMSIKIVRVDGGPVDMAHAALESVGKAFLLPLDCLLGWILYPRRRQRIFNYISETIVIKVA